MRVGEKDKQSTENETHLRWMEPNQGMVYTFYILNYIKYMIRPIKGTSCEQLWGMSIIYFITYIYIGCGQDFMVWDDFV